MVMTLGSLSVDGNDKNAIGFIVGGNSDLRYVMNGDCIYGRYFNKNEVEAGRSVYDTPLDMRMDQRSSFSARKMLSANLFPLIITTYP